MNRPAHAIQAAVIFLTNWYLRLMAWFQNLEELPELLRTLCTAIMLIGPIVLLWLVVPGHDTTMNGQRMSYSQLWRSGAGLAGVMGFGLLTTGAWSLAARQRWSRWALVAAFIIPIAVMPKTLTPDLPMLIINCLIPAAVLYAYLFRSERIRAYLEPSGGDKPAA